MVHRTMAMIKDISEWISESFARREAGWCAHFMEILMLLSKTFVLVLADSPCLCGCFSGVGLLKVRLPKWPVVGVVIGWV